MVNLYRDPSTSKANAFSAQDDWRCSEDPTSVIPVRLRRFRLAQPSPLRVTAFLRDFRVEPPGCGSKMLPLQNYIFYKFSLKINSEHSSDLFHRILTQ